MKSILILLLTIQSSFAAISGADDRHEVIDAPARIQEIAKSIPALIRKKYVKELKDGTFKIEGPSYTDTFNFCPDTRFTQNQTLAANCSAFLIGKNRIGTAGHCIENGGKIDLEDYLVVFDYKLNHHGQNEFIIPKENIYTPKKALHYIFNFPGDKDVAVIELDRNVTNRTPLKMATERIEVDEDIYILGFPFGLAMKYQDNGFVTRATDSHGGLDSFEHNLDIFSVNSVSAIFSAKTDEIVGILVRGTGSNYEEDISRGCNVWGGEISKGRYSGEGNYIDLLKF